MLQERQSCNNIHPTPFLQRRSSVHNANKNVYNNKRIFNQKIKKKQSLDTIIYDNYDQKWERYFLGKLIGQVTNNHEPNMFNDIQRQNKKVFLSKKLNKRSKQYQKYKAYAAQMKIPSLHQMIPSGQMYKKTQKKKQRYDLEEHLKKTYNYKKQPKKTFQQSQKIIDINIDNDKNKFTKTLQDFFNKNNFNLSQHYQPKVQYKRSAKTAGQKRKMQTAGQKRKIQNKILNIKQQNQIQRLKSNAVIQMNNKNEYETLNYINHNKSQIIEESKEKRDNLSNFIFRIKQNNSNKVKSPLIIQKQNNQQQKKYDHIEIAKGISFKKKIQTIQQYRYPSQLQSQFHKEELLNMKQQYIQINLKNQKNLNKVNKQANDSPIMTQKIKDKNQNKQKLIQFKKIVKNSKQINKYQKLSPSKRNQIKTVQKINCKILAFNSQDNYICRILKQREWIVLKQSKSTYFHLKWVFKPKQSDYQNLLQSQYINHIKNSEQITTKNNLHKNLNKYRSQWLAVSNHFPLTYDLSKPLQRKQFEQQYINQLMMNLLRKTYEYIQRHKSQQVHSFRIQYQKIYNGEIQQNKQFSSILKNKNFKPIQLEDYKNYDKSFLLNINLISEALKYWRNIRKQQQLQQDFSYHFFTFQSQKFNYYIQDFKKYVNCQLDSKQIWGSQFLATPSTLLIQRIVKQYVYFRQKCKQKWQVYGRNNVWIVKPCSASRGIGIFLQDKYDKIIEDAKGIQSRIVQKYIQKPLLLNSLQYKKCDLRQWVLLKSVQPLQIYMFSHFYVRVCSQKYNDHIKNLKAHLTNYSFNKKYYQNASQSVIDSNSFKQMLKNEYQVDFDAKILPKIKQIIIKSIKSGQQLLDDMNGHCFSLLGYDILLDQLLNPWILQINMSPACQQRTQWLKQYLQKMGKGLLQIILPSNYLQKKQNYDQLVQITQQSRQVTDHCVTQQKINKQQNNEQIKVQNIRQETQRSEQFFQKQNQITYEQFLTQHLVQNNDYNNDESNDLYYNKDQNWQRVVIQKQQQKKQNISLIEQHIHQDSKPSSQYVIEQIIQKVESKPMTLILIEEQIKQNNQEQLEQNEEIDKKAKNEQQYNQKQNKNKKQNQQLKWNLICYEQYKYLKKQQFILQIHGNKINKHQIQNIEQKIYFYQQQKKYLQQSIVHIQSHIRTYIARKRLMRQSLCQIQQKIENNINALQKIQDINMQQNNQEKNSSLNLLIQNYLSHSIIQQSDSLRQTFSPRNNLIHFSRIGRLKNGKSKLKINQNIVPKNILNKTYLNIFLPQFQNQKNKFRPLSCRNNQKKFEQFDFKSRTNQLNQFKSLELKNNYQFGLQKVKSQILQN